jgi:hypothetical protein
MAAAVGCAIHGCNVPGSGLRDEQHAVRATPIDFDFHMQSLTVKSE